jgi:L-asparaginase II
MLRACVAQGWSLDYTDPSHPLQVEIAAAATEASGRAVEPTGTDGCGVPTLRSDTVGLARIFSRLVNDPAYAEVAAAAAAHASLTADGTRAEARLATWLPAVVKGGAEGCIGLGMLEHGVAFAAKSWTGLSAPAVVALLALIDRVGLLSDHQRAMLDSIAHPAVLGGGQRVGEIRALDE